MKTFSSKLTSHRWQYAAVLQAIAALLKDLKTRLGKYKQDFEDKCSSATWFQQWTIGVLKRLCCPTGSWSAPNESASIFLSYFCSLIFSCESVDNNSLLDLIKVLKLIIALLLRKVSQYGTGEKLSKPLLSDNSGLRPIVWTTEIITSEARISHRRSHWKQEELRRLLKAPESFSSTDGVHQTAIRRSALSISGFSDLKNHSISHSFTPSIFPFFLSLHFPFFVFRAVSKVQLK